MTNQETSTQAEAVIENPKPRILVVDDEEPLLRLLEAKFVRAGFDVDTALDGVDAWEKVLAHPPDVLLTDYRMPGLDGLELCKRLLVRPNMRGVPVMVMTSPWCKINEQLGRLANVVALVEKPLKPGDLVARAQQCVAERRG